MPDRSKLLRKLAISLGVFALLLVGLEVGLRIAGYGKALARYYDPDVGWLFLPNQSREMLTTDKQSLGMLVTNSEGFRGRVASPRKADGVKRIVCMGDSFTHGWGVATEDTYPSQLDALLPDAEVLNYGAPGFNVWNSLRLYEKKVRALEPDLVVFALYRNDAEPESGGPRHTDSWILTALGRTAIVEAFNLHLRNSFSIFHAGRTPETKQKLNRYHSNWHEIVTNPNSEIAAPFWEAAMADLAEFAAAVRADGADFAVMLFPSNEQWVRARKAERAGEDLEAVRKEHALQPWIAERVAALGVPFLDLYPVFVASEETPFGEIDRGHPGRLGYTLTAAAVVDWLRAEGLL